MEVCLKISGRVQGVGYRRWAVRKAAEIGDISGYVCNFENGDVLVLLNGNVEKIKEFQQSAYNGPLFAKVIEVADFPRGKVFFPPIEKGVFKKI